ncbi:MAG: DUF72 domain-containing protein [bacterium]
MPNVFIGTSGFSYEHWYGNFYPPSLAREEMLSFYSEHFQSVEINSSFYRLPFEGMIKGWYRRSPKNFKFVLKASRRITHLLKLVNCSEALKIFLDRIKGLKEKLSIVLFQLPPSLKKDIPRLKGFIKELPNNFSYCIEFRNNSWFDNETFSLLGENNIASCIVSAPKIETHIVATSPFVYIRMHGATSWYNYDYSLDELKQLAYEINGFLKDGIDVHCYFNNDFEAYAIKNAKGLMELVKNL